MIVGLHLAVQIMSVDLLAEISNQNDPLLQNWFDIENLILPHFGPRLLDISQAHSSTFFKIRFADYHLFILQQIYHPNTTQRTGDTQNWVRAEMHSIIYNLYSALDSLAYEINLAYAFGIDSGEIKIHHKHPKSIKDCLRCELNKINDDLASYLNQSLSQPWFDRFRKLRNQITHRHLPVFGNIITVGNGGSLKIKIPDDPANMNPDPSSGFSQNLELRKYCEDTREDVRKVIEEVYPRIKQRIRHVYGI